jgi:hypothetical protein
MRWKFETSGCAGCMAYTGSAADSGLSESYTCESPLSSSTGLPKPSVLFAIDDTRSS